MERKNLSTFVALMTISLAALFLLGIAGCKKENKISQPPKYIMKLASEIEKDNDMKIQIGAEDADKAGVWIDLDNNGKKDPGEAVEELGKFGEDFTFKLKSQTFSIYGKVGSLFVSECKLTSIETKENPALKVLSVSKNKIKTMDLSGNPDLYWLFCSSQEERFKITELKINKNKNLSWLDCSGNKISNLDISQNTALSLLGCNNNELTGLNASNNPKLALINIGNNKLEAEALNTLYGQLNKKQDGELGRSIEVKGNPGAAASNKKIATDKGWIVVVD